MSYNNATNFFVMGELAELRMITGESVFGSAFTPNYVPYGHADANHEATTASNVKLLIHSNTTNDSTTFTDSSPNEHEITAVGGAKHITATGYLRQFDGTVSGSPSVLFFPEGSTAGKDTLGFPLQDTVADVLSLNDPAYFEFPPNSDLAFGGKDFTVEFWINIQELAQGVIIGNAWGSSITDRAGWSVYWFDGDLYLGWSNTVGGSWVGDHAKAWTPDINTWIHFHLVRSGDTFTFYENNSVITSSFTRADPMPTELTKPFRLSSDPDDSAGNFFNARYDEVRVYHKALSSAERIQNYNHGAVAHGKTVIEE